MKYISSILILSALVFNAGAITTQRIHLKNGTVLNGYISYQDRNKIMTVVTDSALVCVSDEYAKPGRSLSKSLGELNDLNSAWGKWATDNGALTGSGSDKRMQMNEIDFVQKRYYSDNGKIDITDSVVRFHSTFEDRLVRSQSNRKPVRILEKGSKIKYLELTPNTYTITWNDVDRISSDKRPQTALSGINRTYYLKNGSTVSGQYAGETKSTVSTYTPEGMIETIEKSNIDRFYLEPCNPSQSMFEQSELLDIVDTEHNGKYSGIIIRRDYSPNVLDLVVEQSNGNQNRIKLSDIKSYSKESNNGYKPLYDILPKDKEVFINRILADSVNVTKNGNSMILDSIPAKVKILKSNSVEGTPVTIEYANSGNGASFDFILVKLSKIKIKKNELPGFVNDVEVMTKYRPVNTSVSVNKTAKMEFVLPSAGWYAIYDPSSKKAMPFKIE